jgi:hypothetical protein
VRLNNPRGTYLLPLTLILSIGVGLACSLQSPKIEPGDIVFQSLASPQGEAIRIATGSDYSHCGIVYTGPDGELYVLEAVQPVRLQPLEKWIESGIDHQFKVMRLRGADTVLTEDVLRRMYQAGRQMLGKNYDLAFNWSDEQIYCSELVWKLYAREAGISLAPLRTLQDYDLSHPLVEKKLQERYGNAIPYDEPMIAPSDLLKSGFLQPIYSGSDLPQ